MMVIRLLILFFLCGFCDFCVSAEEIRPQGLLNFSTKIPIEVDSEKVLSNPDQQNRNNEIQKEKTLPLGKIISALLAIAILALMKSLSKSREEPVISAKTAKEEALIKLEVLESKKLEIQENYAELSDILRRYIEDRYQIKALNQTTEEFLSEVQQNSAQFPEVDLSRFLSLADLVKFAQREPSEKEFSSGYDLAKKIIEK